MRGIAAQALESHQFRSADIEAGCGLLLGISGRFGGPYKNER